MKLCTINKKRKIICCRAVPRADTCMGGGSCVKIILGGHPLVGEVCASGRGKPSPPTAPQDPLRGPTRDWAGSGRSPAGGTRTMEWEGSESGVQHGRKKL